MGDKWQDYAPSSSEWQDFSAESPPTALPSAASPIAPPAIAKPSIPVEKVDPISGMTQGQDNAAAMRSVNSVGRMVQGTAQQFYDVSTPGTFMSMLQKFRPDLAAKIPPSVLPPAGNVKDIPGKAFMTTLGLMGGLENQEAPKTVRPPQSIAEVQSMLGKDAPHPTSTTNVAPPKPVATQAPTISEADSLAKLQAMRKAALPQMPPGTAESGMDPIAQRAWQQSVFGEKPLEDIGAKARQANPEPTRAEVKGTPTQPPFPGPKNYEVTKGADPFTHTNAPQEWLSPKEYSSRIKQYGFDPNSQTISVMFKRGDVYHFKATQQMFNLMKNSSSEGEFLSQIEKMQPGLAGRKVGTVSLGGKQ